MSDISPELEAEAIEWERWRTEVYACAAFNIEGPCCPLCRTPSDDPEHGRYWQALSEPGRFQGQRGIV